MNTIISAAQLKQQLDDPRLVIIDVRWDLMRPAWGLDVFSEGHIPGARYMSLDDELAGPLHADSGRHPLPKEANVCAAFRTAGVHAESKVVVYDQSHGGFASRAWWLLRWLGHQHACVLDGGLSAWEALRLPTERDVTPADCGDFTGSGDPSWLVSTEDIPNLLAAGVPLVDARDVDRFAGRSEPIDPVAGHIPGAINAVFTSFQTETATFLPSHELERRWSQEIGIQPGKPWVVMCGSGVTACHLALSGTMAGLQMPALYAGSWSEWIRDPDRPVAKIAAPSK